MICDQLVDSLLPAFCWDVQMFELAVLVPFFTGDQMDFFRRMW